MSYTIEQLDCAVSTAVAAERKRLLTEITNLTSHIKWLKDVIEEAEWSIRLFGNSWDEQRREQYMVTELREAMEKCQLALVHPAVVTSDSTTKGDPK